MAIKSHKKQTFLTKAIKSHKFSGFLFFIGLKSIHPYVNPIRHGRGLKQPLSVKNVNISSGAIAYSPIFT